MRCGPIGLIGLAGITAPIFSQKPTTEKKTAAAGSAIAQNRIASLTKTVSAKINLVFFMRSGYSAFLERAHQDLRKLHHFLCSLCFSEATLVSAENLRAKRSAFLKAFCDARSCQMRARWAIKKCPRVPKTRGH